MEVEGWDMKNRRVWVIRAYCFFIGFYLLYLPDLSILIPGMKSSLLVMGFAFVHILVLGKTILNYIRHTKLFTLVFSYVLAALYLLFIIFLMKGQFNAVISNITGIGQIINFCAIGILLKRTGMDYKQMLSFLISLGVAQAVIVVIMIISPVAKEVANYLYLTPLGTGNILRGVVVGRVYGITADYTYMLPSVLSLIAVYAFVYAFVFKCYRYYGYCALILLAALMNGRTGVYVFAGIIVLFVIYLAVRKYYPIRLTVLSGIAALTALFGAALLFFFMPDKIQWVIGGFKDSLSVLGGQEHTGNMTTLAGQMLFVPQGIGLLIGEGHRVFGMYGDVTVGASSDIGYINDLFKGGILYYLLFYAPLFIFIIRQLLCKKDGVNNMLVHLCFAGSLLMIVFANYKGECMTGSGLIMCVVFLYMCVADLGNIKKYVGKGEMKTDEIHGKL